MTEADVEFQRYHTTLPDGGGYYAETNLHNFVVEPWNAYSSLFLLLPAIYWAIKIKGRVRENAFVAYCIPLLMLGGLGSTFFHAFRSSPFLLMMDVLPILLLTLSVAAYLWKRLLNNWYIALAIVAGTFALRMTVDRAEILSVHTAANFSYAIAGFTIFFPAILIAFRTKFYHVKSLLLSIVLFALALFFRETDAWNVPVLTMGTHFLWHIFTAGGAFFLAKYLYHLANQREEIEAKPAQVEV